MVKEMVQDVEKVGKVVAGEIKIKANVPVVVKDTVEVGVKVKVEGGQGNG